MPPDRLNRPTDRTRGRAGDVVRPSVWREAVPHAGHLPATRVPHPRRRRHAHQPRVVGHEPDPAGGRRGRGARARGADVHDVVAAQPVRLRASAAAHQVLPDAARHVRTAHLLRRHGGRADPPLLALHRPTAFRVRGGGHRRQHLPRRAAGLLVGLHLLLAQV